MIPETRFPFVDWDAFVRFKSGGVLRVPRSRRVCRLCNFEFARGELPFHLSSDVDVVYGFDVCNDCIGRFSFASGKNASVSKPKENLSIGDFA